MRSNSEYPIRKWNAQVWLHKIFAIVFSYVCPTSIDVSGYKGRVEVSSRWVNECANL